MNEAEDMREQGDQIREVLSQLKALQVEEDTYLKLEDVYSATANILYPEGLTTEDQYKRLVAISKAGCVAIGYSKDEITLLPPVVGFDKLDTYLKKRPIITDEIIVALIDELIEANYEFIDKPVIAIKREKLAEAMARKQRQAYGNSYESEPEHLIQRGDEVAEKLGFRVEKFNDPPWLAGQIFYAKAMKPNWGAWREAVSRAVNSKANPKIDIVTAVGLRAAFNHRVTRDPEQLISDHNWRDLLDELGFVYDKEQLTPKPLNITSSKANALTQAILGITAYNHPKIGQFLIKDDLMITAREALGVKVAKGLLDRLITDGMIGRVLIKLGYEITSHWFSRYEFEEVSLSKEGGQIFTRAIRVSPIGETQALASGFRIHSPVLVRDKHTLVYMELLGPRQAVKANWAALRQNKSHYVHGLLYVEKEDKLTTLKTTLPCGWDHWCLIHRQASYSKMTPNSTFYLIDHSPCPSGPPSTFMAFLAKSLAIPILAEWAEYLWVEGRMKELITPLSKNCYGLGGWKVETSEWSKIISDGLADKKISF